MGVFSSAVLVKRLNRRTLFISSELLAALSIFVVGGYFYMERSNPIAAHSLGWLPLVSVIVFFLATGWGITPLCWVVANEVLPAKFRSFGSAIAAFTYWTCAFIATKTFENLQESLTEVGPFWFYGTCSVLGVLFGLIVMPETSQKTPEQISALF